MITQIFKNPKNKTTKNTMNHEVADVAKPLNPIILSPRTIDTIISFIPYQQRIIYGLLSDRFLWLLKHGKHLQDGIMTIKKYQMKEIFQENSCGFYISG